MFAIAEGEIELTHGGAVIEKLRTGWHLRRNGADRLAPRSATATAVHRIAQVVRVDKDHSPIWCRNTPRLCCRSWPSWPNACAAQRLTTRVWAGRRPARTSHFEQQRFERRFDQVSPLSASQVLATVRRVFLVVEDLQRHLVVGGAVELGVHGLEMSTPRGRLLLAHQRRSGCPPAAGPCRPSAARSRA